MPKKSAAHQKKVDEAVRILNTTTGVGVIVPQAMILVGFPKKDIANETVRRMIRRRLEALKAKQTRPLLVVTNNDADLSTLTGGGEDDDPTASATTTTTTTGPVQHPKPKRKQIRHTARAIQQSRVDNLAAKRHKSDAHKAAVRLFHAEKQKPDGGMSIRMVYDAITAKYETCPSIATISRYAKQGLINASPLRTGPLGHISAVAYKFLCQAYKSLVPINQMNVCTGDNSRAKMIPIFAKTFSFGTVKATGLLNRVIRNTATDINAEKILCGGPPHLLDHLPKFESVV